MRRVVRLLILAGFLALISYGLQRAFGLELEEALALVALIEIAAVIIEAYDASRSRIKIYYPSLVMYSVMYEIWVFIFEAQITNVGNSDDVLERIDHLFYNRDIGIINSTMVSGAGPLGNRETGHILPYPLPPQQNIEVASQGDFKMTGIAFRPELKKDFVLRCKFIFSNSKPLVIRITPLGKVGKFEGFWLSIRETLLRQKKTYS